MLMRAAAWLAAAGMLALAMPAAADHVQTDAGRTVSFDHVAGNQYWVEVRLGGGDGPSAARVEVSHPYMAWTPMARTSWGTWALNQYITPGQMVQFRATLPDGVQVVSCPFTHPDGKEQCGPGAPGFAAEFHDAKGNEWWLQVGVYPNAPLAGVDARIDGGSWKPLRLQGWNAVDWAASYHAPEGSVVQFRAVGRDGGVATSGCYAWPAATPMACDGVPPPPPPPAKFDATFSGVQGNQWWVQLTVSAGEPVQKVDVRLDCAGSWKPLVYRGYGWSASYNIPAGTKVDFRATSASGAVDLSDGYVWPKQVTDGENEPAAKTAPC